FIYIYSVVSIAMRQPVVTTYSTSNSQNGYARGSVTSRRSPLQARLDSSPRQVHQLQKATTIQRQALHRKGGLPDKLRAAIEKMSGLSLDGVQVHYNSRKPAQVNAHAYAQGTDIYLGPGQERYLPHEAWHVVQQKQGRVR